MEADDGRRELRDLQNHLRLISKDAAEISNGS
ncbi:hypothetical protein BDA96_02G250700 [Sorghum bicolor]|uniref:Uncharacterized protein n=2 Tax=Sorghum bicolor TaxID=4558 RepID=A0A921RP80_SORBI|nr:hypothetical protein BDA96_02G250700 [Sorghum bicolor]KXG35858.1 hypothetical protein SORBI_3002G239500 [Sorghum bicolor]